MINKSKAPNFLRAALKTIANTRSDMARDLLIDAARRWDVAKLKRLQAALDVWKGDKTAETHPMQKAKGFFISGFRDEAWFDVSHFPFIGVLRDNYLAIREEAQQFLDGAVAPAPYGLADSAAPDARPLGGNPEDWREWCLYRAGEFNQEKCTRFPMTVKTLQAVLEHTSFMMNATFLILGPNQHLPQHTDQNNIFANIWLPLVTPAGCYLTVKGRTVHPEAGEIFAFNHSYLHAAGNYSQSRRIVLSLSVFHPELSEVERQVISAMAPMLVHAVPRPATG